MLGAQEQASTLGVSYLSFGCFVKSSDVFAFTSVFAILKPAFVSLTVLGYILLYVLVKIKDGAKGSDPGSTSSVSQGQDQPAEPRPEHLDLVSVLQGPDAKEKESSTPVDLAHFESKSDDTGIKEQGYVEQDARSVSLCSQSCTQTRIFLYEVVVVVFYLLYSELTQRALLCFSCIELGQDGDGFYLSQDLSVECWSSKAHLLLVCCVGVPMLLVYVFGLPILAGRCLKRHESSVLGIMRIMYEKQRQDLRLRFEEEVKKAEQKARGESQPQSTSSKCCRRLTADERLKKNKAKQAKQAKHLFDDATNTVRRRFSFLFLGYRSETYWFESVVLLRKACLNIVVVLFACSRPIPSI